MFRFQFSLKTIFIIITVVALLLVAWTISGLLYLILLLATLLFIPAFLAGIIYGQGDDRAFCIGGAAGSLVALYLVRGGFPSGYLVDLLFWPLIWVWIAASGWVSIKVRSLVRQRTEKVHPPTS